MFETTSEIFYILMLILLGKGYTVTRARLRARSVVKVTVFMSLYCVTCIALFTYERQVRPWYRRMITDSRNADENRLINSSLSFVWGSWRQYFDPGKVLYVYESPAGYGLLVLRFFGWVMFVYGIAFTLKHYPEKNGFYLPFFFFSSLWYKRRPPLR